MWFRRKTAEAQLSAELRYHFERLIRESIAAGMEPAEAQRLARLEFGGIEQIKEECRDVRGRWLEDLGQDLRYTARTLRRSPGFLVVSVVSLALGIGANTAIFSLINAVMLRSLPVKEPGRLVQICRLLKESGKPGVASYPLFQYFQNNLKSISGAAAEMSAGPAIMMDGAEEAVTAEMVSGGHYSLLGMEPAAGRLLGPADDVIAPASPAAVIGYRYWQRRFGLNSAAIGKTFALQDKLFTIVGVTPPGFEGTRPGRDPDITVPLAMMLSDTQRRFYSLNMLSVMARLKPGVTRRQADAELQVLWQSFLQRMAAHAPEKGRPDILRQRAGVLSAATGFSPLRNDYADALLVLMGIVALVLLLACANLSGLLLARAASRQREISIRLAMGAVRGRLMRQFLAESFVLAVLGGCTGLVLSRWFSVALVTMMANGGRLLLSVAPDWRVLAFTGAVSLLACVLAGLAPGWHALRVNLNPALKEMRAGGRKLGKALVIAQLAISMVLLVGATLFVGTLVKLYSVDRGVRTDGVLTFGVRSTGPYPQPRSRAVQQALLDGLNALPGVDSASAAQMIPIGGGLWTRHVQVEGYTFRSDESEDAGFDAIAPKYFATIGTPLLSGREFDGRDTNSLSKAAIVNESFARYFFGAQSPLGRHVTSVNVTYEIVGVVRDAKYQSLRQDVMNTMYIPWMQGEGDQPSNYSFLVRVAAGDPLRLAPPLERLVREADPGLRLLTPQTYSAIVDHSIVTERIMATLGGFFGLVALLVACLGIFGVMAFQVSRRTNEIGLRMALGASRSGIVALVLGEVGLMLVAGSAMGALAGLTLSGLAGKMLFGITRTQPAVFALPASVLGVAALAAGWFPARRAARVDPMVALRHE